MNYLLQVTITGLNAVCDSMERQEARDERKEAELDKASQEYADKRIGDATNNEIKEAMDSFSIDDLPIIYSENDLSGVLDVVEFCIDKYWRDIWAQEYKDKQQ